MSFSLQELCNCKVIADLEHFPTSLLSLLPLRVRRELLCSLPVVDVVQLERSQEVVQGIDMEQVWKTILDQLMSTFTTDVPVEFVKQETAKDTLVTTLVHLLLHSTSYDIKRCGITKWSVIGALMYSLPVQEDLSPLAVFFSQVHFTTRLVLPPRYVGYDTPQKLSSIVEKVANALSSHVKVIEVRHSFRISVDAKLKSVSTEVLHSLLRQVEKVSIEAHGAANVQDFIHVIRSILYKSNKTKSLDSQCLEEVNFTSCKCVMSEFLQKLAALLIHPTDGGCCNYTKVKRIKLVGSDSQSRKCNIPDISLVTILVHQKNLEELHIEEIFDSHKQELYCHGQLYFSLPLVVARPSFRSLYLGGCFVPRNAVQNLIQTFLCTPTGHYQSLNMAECYFLPSEEPENIYGLPVCSIVPEDAPCVNPELKSLSLHIDNQHGLPGWLLNHPNFTLKQLELSCGLPCAGLHLSHGLCSSQYSVSDLDFWSKMSQHEGLIVDFKEEVNAYTSEKLLSSSNLIGLGFKFSLEDIHVLNLLVDYLTSSRAICLRRLCLKSSTFQELDPLYMAIFSLRQLPEFTLDFSDVFYSFDTDMYETFYSAWRDYSGGRKLRRLIFTQKSPDLIIYVADPYRLAAVKRKIAEVAVDLTIN